MTVALAIVGGIAAWLVLGFAACFLLFAGAEDDDE